MAIHRGQSIRVDGLFDQVGENGEAVPYDPSPPPTLTLRHPASGTSINATVVRQATGVYYADITVDRVGRWAYRWTVPGPQPAVQEGGFMVEMTSFPV